MLGERRWFVATVEAVSTDTLAGTRHVKRKVVVNFDNNRGATVRERKE